MQVFLFHLINMSSQAKPKIPRSIKLGLIYSNFDFICVKSVDLMYSESGSEGVRHYGRAPSLATCPSKMGAWPCRTMRWGSTKGPLPHKMN